MNLILIVIDSLRQDHVGAYGNPWIRTPNLDAFFKESVRFTRAYPEALPTLPFRRSLLTGKRVYPFANWKPYHPFYPMSTVFKTRGSSGLDPHSARTPPWPGCWMQGIRDRALHRLLPPALPGMTTTGTHLAFIAGRIRRRQDRQPAGAPQTGGHVHDRRMQWRSA